MFASSSSGSLNSQIPIASKPAAAYAATSSAKDASDGRDLREREPHERPGSFASRRCGQSGLRQRLGDEVAGAGAETGARVRARADVPEPVDGVACPGASASGRQRRFWSSAHEPP